jgi:hypothetical protein
MQLALRPVDPWGVSGGRSAGARIGVWFRAADRTVADTDTATGANSAASHVICHLPDIRTRHR